MDYEIRELLENLFTEYYNGVPESPEEWFCDETYSTLHTKYLLDEILHTLNMYSDGREYTEED